MSDSPVRGSRPHGDLQRYSPDDELSLAEVVNRVLDKGAVISGDVVISVAGVDLVYLGLKVLLSSVESMRDRIEPGGGM
jgi:gas vesicle structural protein